MVLAILPGMETRSSKTSPWALVVAAVVIPVVASCAPQRHEVMTRQTSTIEERTVAAPKSLDISIVGLHDEPAGIGRPGEAVEFLLENLVGAVRTDAEFDRDLALRFREADHLGGVRVFVVAALAAPWSFPLFRAGRSTAKKSASLLLLGLSERSQVQVPPSGVRAPPIILNSISPPQFFMASLVRSRCPVPAVWRSASAFPGSR